MKTYRYQITIKGLPKSDFCKNVAFGSKQPKNAIIKKLHALYFLGAAFVNPDNTYNVSELK